MLHCVGLKQCVNREAKSKYVQYLDSQPQHVLLSLRLISVITKINVKEKTYQGKPMFRVNDERMNVD